MAAINSTSGSNLRFKPHPSQVRRRSTCLLLCLIVGAFTFMSSPLSFHNVIKFTTVSNYEGGCDQVLSSSTVIEGDDYDASTISLITKKFDAHAQALAEATKKQRGYKPKEERRDHWLDDTQGSYWWLDEKVEESFSFAELDQTYDLKYFKTGPHPGGESPYTKYILRFGSLFMPGDSNLGSLVEFGNGGGGFSTVFYNEFGQDNFVTVEGTGAGVAQTLQRGVPKDVIVQHDLRYPLFLGRRFDIAVCTEVVEHVEPPFASQIVLTIILHADVVWLSFKPLGLVNRAWINHPNERPLKMWKNLFDFYGFDIVMIPRSLHGHLNHRGDFLAYRRDNTTLSKVTEQILIENLDPEHK